MSLVNQVGAKAPTSIILRVTTKTIITKGKVTQNQIKLERQVITNDPTRPVR